MGRLVLLSVAILGAVVLGAVVWRWLGEAGMVTTEPEEVWVPTPVPTEPVGSRLWDVPFATQAPFGEWEDPRQQDGCEEAAVLMVKCFVFWGSCPVSAGVIDKKFAKDEILRMTEYQMEKYGSFVDTSAKDTAERLFGAYYGIEYEVMRIDNSEHMARLLMEGKVLVAPADGRKLKNPFFRAGGPERHMVVVIGYDAFGKEFITNDPGTRRGKGYRYAEDVLWEAIGDYLTGERKLIGNRPKMVIGVRGSNRHDGIRR